MTILIVDDLPIFRSLFSTALELAGRKVATAQGGWHALEQIKDGELPELVLLDYTLPDMEAMEFLRKLRQLDNGDEVAVILAISMFDRDCIRVARRLGVKEFLLKSEFQAEGLRDQVAQLLDRVYSDKEMDQLARQTCTVAPIAEQLTRIRHEKEQKKRAVAAKQAIKEL